MLKLNDNFSQYKDFEDLYDDGRKDLKEEIKRIEQRLVGNNSKKISRINLNLLSNIYDCIRKRSRKEKNPEGVKVENTLMLSENDSGKEELTEIALCSKESLPLLLKDYESVAMGKSKITDLNQFIFDGRKKKIDSFVTEVYSKFNKNTDHLMNLKDEIVSKGVEVSNLSTYLTDKLDEVNFMSHRIKELEFERLKKEQEILALREKWYSLKKSRDYDTERNFNNIPNAFQVEDRNIDLLLTEDKGSARHCTCTCNIY